MSSSFLTAVLALQCLFILQAPVAARLLLRHEVLEARRPQEYEVPGLAETLAPEVPAITAVDPVASTYTFITPSPNAEPVPVTVQSQVVTVYQPVFTVCVASPLTWVQGKIANIEADVAPFQNVSAPAPTPTASEACSTGYVPNETTVCATTLSGVVEAYTVTECEQSITFSTEYGYALDYPTPTPVLNATLNRTATLNSSQILTTPAPVIQSLTTYYMAPWQSLTAGGYPGEVDVKVCRPINETHQDCQIRDEEWSVYLSTYIETFQTEVDITTDIPGPAELTMASAHMSISGAFTHMSIATNLTVTYTREVEVIAASERTNTRTVLLATESPDTTTTITVTRTRVQTIELPVETGLETVDEA